MCISIEIDNIAVDTYRTIYISIDIYTYIFIYIFILLVVSLENPD